MYFLRTLWVVLKATLAVLGSRLLRGPHRSEWTLGLEIMVQILRRGARANLNTECVNVRGLLVNAPLHPALARRVTRENAEVGGVAAVVFTPEGWRHGAPEILYLHGGGYCVCSPGTHKDLISRISLASGARCTALDYRLAPEHPFPAAVHDAEAAYLAMLDGGTEPRNLFIGGDSAGGGLTVATLVRVRDREAPLPAGAILLSPWLDLSIGGESIDGMAEDDYLFREVLEQYAHAYAPGELARDPLASPIRAKLKGLPPLQVHYGEREVLRSEIEAFIKGCQGAGVSISARMGEGMVHVWPAFASVLPQGQSAIDQIGAFVRSQTGGLAGRR